MLVLLGNDSCLVLLILTIAILSYLPIGRLRDGVLLPEKVNACKNALDETLFPWLVEDPEAR